MARSLSISELSQLKVTTETPVSVAPRPGFTASAGNGVWFSTGAPALKNRNGAASAVSVEVVDFYTTVQLNGVPRAIAILNEVLVVDCS